MSLRSIRPLWLLPVLLLLFISPAAAPAVSKQAQPEGRAAVSPPLADRIPAGALAYVGWAGAEQVAQAFEGTHAQALVRASEFEDLFTRYLPELLAKLAEQEPEAREPIAAISEIAPILWQRPSAFVFGGFNTQLGGAPIPKLMVVCDAGERAEAMERRIRRALDQAEQAPMKGFVSRQGGFVRIVLGYDLNELDRLAAGDGAGAGAAGEGTLAGVAEFRQAFTGLTERPISAAYVDFPAIMATVDALVAQNAPAEEQEQIRQLIEVSGVRGLGRLSVTSGFSGKMYETRGFLGLTAREGFLKLVPTGPLDEQTLAAVPAGSVMVAADQVDLAGAIAAIRQMIVQIEPGAAEQMDRIVGQVNQAAGADVERDVLGQLGTTWASYVHPRIGGGVLSGVVVNRPKDPAKLEDSLTRVSQNVLNLANAHIREGTEGEISLAGRRVEMGGQTLHVLNAPFVAPTWTIDGERGVLRIGLYPQSVLSARAVEGEPFANSPAWQAMRQQLAPDGAVASIRFYDLPALASDAYPLLLIMTQAGVGMGDLFGEKLGTRPPVVVLPPLATMMAHVEPSAAVAWVAEDGIRFRAIEPFPMSSVLATDWQSMGMQQYSTMLGVLVPSLNRAREAANRIKSGSNLRFIGQAMRQAAIDDVRGGKYPPDLQTLFLGSDLPMDVFLSPRTGTRLPEMMAQAREVQAQWVAENSDFVYLAGGLTDTTPAMVMVAYEDPAKVGDDEGVNVLYGDGSVRFVTLPEFQQDIERHIAYRRQKGLEVPAGLGQ